MTQGIKITWEHHGAEVRCCRGSGFLICFGFQIIAAAFPMKTRPLNSVESISAPDLSLSSESLNQQIHVACPLSKQGMILLLLLLFTILQETHIIKYTSRKCHTECKSHHELTKVIVQLCDWISAVRQCCLFCCGMLLGVIFEGNIQPHSILEGRMEGKAGSGWMCQDVAGCASSTRE